ncbi:MAG: hypothetical protein HY318_05195, partial [Armatimonadetes bacterium]|nr:hypothetical protein [Armatimonadota bacterium]
LFITSNPHQFEALAIARHFDLEGDIIPLWSGVSEEANNADAATVNVLRYDLGKQHYDAIAMTGGYMSALPDDCEAKIAELIQSDGVGFVYALPGIFPRVPALQGKPSPLLDPLLPLRMDTSGYKAETRLVEPAGNHPLSRGCAFSRMLWACNVDVSAAPGATVLLRGGVNSRLLAAAVTRGKGRVVAYNRCLGETVNGYPFLPYTRSFNGFATSLEESGKPARWMQGIEFADQFYGWLGKAILWAAQKQAPVSFVWVDARDGMQHCRVVNATKTSQPCRVRVVVHAPFNTVQKSVESFLTVPANGTIELQQVPPSTGTLGQITEDVFLVDAQGAVLDWSSSSGESAGKVTVKYTQDFSLHEPDDMLKPRLIITARETSDKASIHVELLDIESRLLFDRTLQPSLRPGEPTEVFISIPLKDTGITTRLANLRMTVLVGKEAVEVRDQLFIRQEPDWHTLHILPYAGYDSCTQPDEDVMFDALKAMGHDTLLASYAMPERFWPAVESGFRPIALWMAPFECNSEEVKTRTQWMKKFSPVLYEAQDEPELQFTACAEGRFDSPKDMDRFCVWLQAKYKTLDALNAAWGKKCAKWEEVQRVLWHEVANTDNWNPWFDSRCDLDLRFVEGFGRSADAVRVVEPDRLMSINPRSLDTFGGTDLRAMSRRLHALSMYTDFCSQPPMGYLHLGSRWVDIAQSIIGYTWPSSPGKERITREAWDAVRHGVKHLGWFAPFCDETPPEGRFTFLNGDLTLNEKGKIIAEVNRQLLSGPGDVAVNAEPLREGVFIYYPRSVFYAHTLAWMKRKLDADPKLDPAKLTGTGPWLEQLPCSFVPHLRALGYQFEFGDEEDLTAERLKQTRVVFLSHVICLGQRESELLREFVKRGGCVIAEAGTGRRDESGRAYANTPEGFRDIFGLERPSQDLSPGVEEEKLVPRGAEAFEGFPPSLGTFYRKGRAFFLNSRLPATEDARHAVQQILKTSGIPARYALRENVIDNETNKPVCSLVVRTRGDLTYLLLTGDGNPRASAFCIELPQERHVYDMLSDRSFGLRTRIEGEINYGEAKVFALSPSRVKEVSLLCDRARYRPGEAVNVSISVSTQNGDARDRVIALTLTPRRGIMPVVPRCVVLNAGRIIFRIHVPLNMAKGSYTLTARDVCSGVRADCQFRIAP